MEIKVKPIIVLGKREGLFCRLDGALETVADGEAQGLYMPRSSKWPILNSSRYAGVVSKWDLRPLIRTRKRTWRGSTPTLLLP